MKPFLNKDNFQTHFLVDDLCMGSVAQDPIQTGRFLAYIINHETGSSELAKGFDNLEEALQCINQFPRNWALESTSNCGEGLCGGSKCAGSACKVAQADELCHKHPNQSTIS